MTYRILIILMLCLGCYFPDAYPENQQGSRIPTSSYRNEMTIQADFDKTWSVLVAIISEKGWPLQVVEKNSGIITTGEVRIDNLRSARPLTVASWNTIAYLRRPGRDSVSGYEYGLAFINIFISPIGDSTATSIKVTSRFDAYNTLALEISSAVSGIPSSTRGIWIKWKTTGKLEHDLLNALEAQVIKQ